MSKVDFREVLEKNGFNVEYDLNGLYVIFKDIKVWTIDKSGKEKVLKEFLLMVKSIVEREMIQYFGIWQ